MFLYLSKLLPLFLYPLGLACLLLIVSLALLGKRPRGAAGAIALALTVLFLGGNGWVSSRLVRGLERRYLPKGPLPKVDAIVVLGGMTHPPEPPRPWVEVNEAGDRLLYAAYLYKAGKAPLVILSGGRINWSGESPSEAEDMAVLLKALGVPGSAIIQEPDSLNTYENVVNVHKIMEQQEIERVLVVTSAIHMPRSIQIFEKQGLRAIPAPTDFLVEDRTGSQSTDWASLLLYQLPDAERLEQTTRALKEYIGLLVYRLRGWL